ncbi:hypothetical protein FOL47_004002 [Perkinsus chesapeaki]|uniref:RRM domain-containing protein n=1 Tax=Perkinsus chesapeaki TaxID=330153 RepID=A0A7J6N034_PERCH|nr:hypothetical protein FOL47_004002 [Perkinsus chesapeaki]
MSTVDKLSMSLDDIVKSSHPPRTPSTGGRQRRSGGKGRGSGRSNRSQPYEVAKPPPESAESAERFARAMGVRPGKGSFNSRRGFRQGGSGREYTNNRESSSGGGGCTIKITNIPDDLTWRDIKTSFGAVGPVEFCNVEESRRGGNQAIITFKDSRDAETAIENYDGGEMNGHSQPSDLLQEALRSGGGNNLDDYVDVKIYIKSTDDSSKWHGLLKGFLYDHTPKGYIWQRDPPRIHILDPMSPYLAYGIHLRMGDALHDEWLLVSLTRRYAEIACQISDVDGDPLLIEAAAALPKWLSPENAGNRVWVDQGMVHICPKGPKEQALEIKPLEAGAALDMVFDEDIETIASPSVQRCIINKLKSAPWTIDQMHVRLLLPAVLAEQLIRNPQIISFLMDYLPPDHLAQRGSSAITESIAKGDLATIRVSMTRLHYASLMGIKGTLRMPSRLAYGGQQIRSRNEENTVMLGRLVSLAAHCAVKANNKDTAHFEEGMGLGDVIQTSEGEPVEFERFAKYDGPSDSDTWLTEAMNEAAKGQDELTSEEQEELRDVTSRLNELMNRASGILGVENSHGEDRGEGFDDDEVDDDMSESGDEDDLEFGDAEMRKYMQELDKELQMTMAPEDTHVDVTDDVAVDREVRRNMMKSMRAEDRLNPGPAKLLLEEARQSKRLDMASASLTPPWKVSNGDAFAVITKITVLGELLKERHSDCSGEFRWTAEDRLHLWGARSSDRHRIEDMAETVSQLDKALSDEVRRATIRRRTESTNTLNKMTEQMANEMLDKLQSRVLGKLEKATKAVEALAMRTTTLERGMLQFRGELPSKLLVDASALQKEIRELGDRMGSERKLWLERDRRLLERLDEIGTGLEHKVANECNVFDQQTSGLDKDVEALRRSGNAGGPDCRITEDEQFRGFLLEEMAKIKNGKERPPPALVCHRVGVHLETRARTQADDDIIAAVNQVCGMSGNPQLGGMSQATPLPDVLTTEQLRALVPGGDEMDDTTIELLKKMGNDILDKILSDAASVAKRRKEDAISLSSLEYALEREWGISIRDESSPFYCGERTHHKDAQQQQQQQQQVSSEGEQTAGDGALYQLVPFVCYERCMTSPLLSLHSDASVQEASSAPEAAASPDDDAADDSAVSVTSVADCDSDASTEPENSNSGEQQERLGRVFEEQERRLERLLRERVQLERACLACLNSDMAHHDREDLLRARDELTDLVRVVVQAHARIRDSMTAAAPTD